MSTTTLHARDIPRAAERPPASTATPRATRTISRNPGLIRRMQVKVEGVPGSG